MIKPFSDTINAKQEQFEPTKGSEPGLEPFSAGIHQVAADAFGGPGSGNRGHIGRPGLEGGSLSVGEKGVYLPKQKEKLLNLGLNDIQIRKLEKAWLDGPPEGYKRITRDEFLLSGSDKKKMCKAFFFIDVDKKTGLVDPKIFPQVKK